MKVGNSFVIDRVNAEYLVFNLEEFTAHGNVDATAVVAQLDRIILKS